MRPILPSCSMIVPSENRPRSCLSSILAWPKLHCRAIDVCADKSAGIMPLHERDKSRLVTCTGRSLSFDQSSQPASDTKARTSPNDRNVTSLKLPDPKQIGFLRQFEGYSSVCR